MNSTLTMTKESSKKIPVVRGLPLIGNLLPVSRDVLGFFEKMVPTLADLPNLPYTNYVIHESMRLMPPAWSIDREAIEDVEIGGYLIPKGAQVGMIQYATHRDPRWFENPTAFIPERWENDLIKRLPKYAYFPFGGGARLCIGQQFAMMEAQLMLVAIAQKFSFTLLPGHKVEPQPSITMRPRYGLKMKLQRI